ncbi:MAG TPA: GNAT family protein [Dehalococcoidia bacterium]|nr:GNAT family protein [Dehalococcoidia bacterium]
MSEYDQHGRGALPGDHPTIVGPLLTFRAVTADDAPDLLRWLRDGDVRQIYSDPPDTLDDVRRHYTEPDVEPCWRFVIEHEGRGIGEIQYAHQYPGADYEWAAGVDIFIGEPDARDRGLGTEAIRTMLRFLFEDLACHRVTIDPEVANARAIRCYEKAGFTFEGVLRHNAFERGEYVDTHFMSMLVDEWPAAKLRWERETGR